MKLMKTLLAATFLVGTLYGVSQAQVREDSFIREAVGTVKYRFDNIGLSSAAIIVDLSDAVTYPHRVNGMAVITDIRVTVDKITTSSGTVRLGVMKNVDASSGTVAWFYTLDFDRDTTGTVIRDFANLSPGVVRAYVSPTFTTPFFLTNDSSAFSTVYQTDVNLPAASGTPTAPAPGDIIFKWDWAGAGATNTNTVDITVELTYYGER